MHIIIPARYASTRLPGKPLADVCGKSLIERVYRSAQQSGARSVTIATDDERIATAAEIFGADVCMTSSHHLSGTDRIGEAIFKLGIDEKEIVVNLQGDEPLMPSEIIRKVASALDEQTDASIATACHPISSIETLRNPNVVKVARDKNGYALYFSRAPIPWPRDIMAKTTSSEIFSLRHIGIYAYRAGFVAQFCSWPPCPLEQAEQLEQLRALWYGARIAVCEIENEPPAGVDTPEDLERIRSYFNSL